MPTGTAAAIRSLARFTSSNVRGWSATSVPRSMKVFLAWFARPGAAPVATTSSWSTLVIWPSMNVIWRSTRARSASVTVASLAFSWASLSV